MNAIQRWFDPTSRQIQYLQLIRDDREFQMRWWQILQDSLLFDGLIAARRGTKGSKYCWQIWLIDLSNNWLIERAMQLMNAIQRDRGSIQRRSKLFYSISTYIIRDDREFQAETKFTKQTNDKKYKTNTTLGVPRPSPIQVLTEPYAAWLARSDGVAYVQHGSGNANFQTYQCSLHVSRHWLQLVDWLS